MMVDIVTPVIHTATQPGHISTFFARNYDLKVGAIKDRLNVARPTIFLGVPLVWEKIADKMRAVGANITGAKAHISKWAKDKAVRKARGAQLGGTGEVPWGSGVGLKILSAA